MLVKFFDMLVCCVTNCVISMFFSISCCGRWGQSLSTNHERDSMSKCEPAAIGNRRDTRYRKTRTLSRRWLNRP